MAYSNNNNGNVQHMALEDVDLPDYSDDEWEQLARQRQEFQNQQEQRRQQLELERQQHIRQRKLWAETWKEEKDKREEDAKLRREDPQLWERKKTIADAEAEKNWARQKDELKKQEADWKHEEQKHPDRYWYRSGCGDADFSGGK